MTFGLGTKRRIDKSWNDFDMASNETGEKLMEGKTTKRSGNKVPLHLLVEDIWAV